MAEPTKLFRNGEEMTAYGPAQVAALLADGWTRAATHVIDDYGDDVTPVALPTPAMDEAPPVATTSKAKAQYGAQVGVAAAVVDKAKLREVSKAKAKNKRDAAQL